MSIAIKNNILSCRSHGTISSCVSCCERCACPCYHSSPGVVRMVTYLVVLSWVLYPVNRKHYLLIFVVHGCQSRRLEWFGRQTTTIETNDKGDERYRDLGWISFLRAEWNEYGKLVLRYKLSRKMCEFSAVTIIYWVLQTISAYVFAADWSCPVFARFFGIKAAIFAQANTLPPNGVSRKHSYSIALQSRWFSWFWPAFSSQPLSPEAL